MQRRQHKFTQANDYASDNLPHLGRTHHRYSQKHTHTYHEVAQCNKTAMCHNKFQLWEGILGGHGIDRK